MKTRKFARLWQLVVMASALSFSTLASGAPDVHVLAIGSNESFKPGLDDLRYAETDAQRFVEAMRTVGLVPAAQATILTGIGVKEFRHAVDVIRSGNADRSAKNRKFIFYFSGHSDDTGLHLKDGLISKDELHHHLKSIEAHTKVAILDSCFSGAITAKGIRRAEEFELPKVEYDEPSGSVLLSASSGRQFAYESESLKSSVFTHYLIAGLYGEADGNVDGIVTVDELYQHVYRNTKWQSLNYPTRSAQEPEYVAKLHGQGAIVLSFPAKTNSKLALLEDMDGQITIASRKGMQFFKVQKIRGQKKVVQLPVGRYRVSVKQANRVGKGDVEVEPIRVAYLGKDDITWSDQALASLGTVKGEKATVEAKAPAVGAHRILFGAHRGYIEDSAAWGPLVEYAYMRTMGRVKRVGVDAGFALNFHSNKREAAFRYSGGGTLRTDSSGAYALGALTYAAPWGVDLALGMGIGQTYHHQEIERYPGDEKPLTQGGAAPGYLMHVGLNFGSARRFGVVWRRETLDLQDVDQESSTAQGDMLGMVLAF